MAFIMNEYDIQNALAFSETDDRPNLYRLAQTLERLAEWTNANSDGWPYWSKPNNASRKAQEYLHAEYLGRYDRRTGEDITYGQLLSALRPIKSFLTRQGVSHSDIIQEL